MGLQDKRTTREGIDKMVGKRVRLNLRWLEGENDESDGGSLLTDEVIDRLHGLEGVIEEWNEGPMWGDFTVRLMGFCLAKFDMDMAEGILIDLP